MRSPRAQRLIIRKPKTVAAGGRIPNIGQHASHRHGNVGWINGHFEGEDVFIVGCGPSMCGFDFSKLEGKFTIALNFASKFFTPYIQAFLDREFPIEMGINFYQQPFRTVTVGSGAMKADGQVGVALTSKSFSTDVNKGLYARRTSGVLGISIAAAGKAKRIFLLGLDQRFAGRDEFEILARYASETDCYDEAEIQKRLREARPGNLVGHFYTDRAETTTPGSKKHKRDDNSEAYRVDSPYEEFQPIRSKVFNLSPFSHLKFFRSMHIKDVLG